MGSAGDPAPSSSSATIDAQGRDTAHSSDETGELYAAAARSRRWSARQTSASRVPGLQSQPPHAADICASPQRVSCRSDATAAIHDIWLRSPPFAVRLQESAQKALPSVLSPVRRQRRFDTRSRPRASATPGEDARLGPGGAAGASACALAHRANAALSRLARYGPADSPAPRALHRR